MYIDIKNLFNKKKITKKQGSPTTGISVEVQSEKLKNELDFIIHWLPNELLDGVRFKEVVFDEEKSPDDQYTIFLTSSMTDIDIKRKIGSFVFHHHRWDKQEEITKKLLIEEKIDLNMFYNVYQTDQYMTLYRMVNADVFAISYGNQTLSLDEIALSINNLYLNKFVENNFSVQHNLDDFVASLFENTKNSEL